MNKEGTVYLAQLNVFGYELTAIGRTEKEARGATELGATIIWGDEFIKVEVDNYAEDLIYLSVSEGQLEAIIVDTNDQMPLDIKFEKVRKEKRDEST